MAHPDLLLAGQPFEQRVGSGIQIQRGQAVFALFALAHLAAQQVSHELLAVADAQHGRTQGKNSRIYRGAARIVYARRPARDDDALGRAKLRGRRFAGAHLGVHAQLAHLARDEVTVLAPGIQDHNLRLGIQIPMVAPPVSLLRLRSRMSAYRCAAACGSDVMRCATIRLADCSRLSALGRASIAFATSGSSSSKTLSLSSTLKAYTYMDCAR